MRYFAILIVGAVLALAVTDQALARGSESPRFLAKQKACKKEATAQRNVGLSLSKRKAYIKECMARA